MSQPEHVKDPPVEFVKSRLLGAAAEAKFVRDPNIYSLAVTPIPIFHITHLEYSSYTQTLFMGFLLLSEQNTMKLLLNSYMSYFNNSLITNIEFVKSRLLGAAAEAKFVRDPKFILWQ
jgi:hypothetical protein